MQDKAMTGAGNGAKGAGGDRRAPARLRRYSSRLMASAVAGVLLVSLPLQGAMGQTIATTPNTAGFPDPYNSSPPPPAQGGQYYLVTNTQQLTAPGQGGC